MEKDFSTDLFAFLQRQSVFIKGIRALVFLLVLYVLLQTSGLVFVDTHEFLDESVYKYSIALNIVVCILLFITYLLFQKQAVRGKDEKRGYRLIVFATAILFLASLTQVHIVGSQNSLHHLLVVAVLLVVSWILKWRDVILFFILGNLGLALLVFLEATGILNYAPLFYQHETFSNIFLDWRIIFGQSLNYIFVLLVTTILVWRLRQNLEHSVRLRNEANDALRKEIQERMNSEKEKERLINQLKESLDDVKTLRGLLPICMNCKNIRDDKGYWQKLETYFQEHSPKIQFSHGLCPDCMEILYPEHAPKKQ